MNKLKLVIAGGRDFNDYPLLVKELMTYADECGTEIGISIVTGMANGADMLGFKFAKEYNVKCYEFPANWNKYGKSAGYKRNEEMGRFADATIVFWDGKSKGTKHMIDFMQQQGKPVKVINY